MPSKPTPKQNANSSKKSTTSKTEKPIELTKKGDGLVQAFDDAAQDHGWQSDQGRREDAEAAKEEYNNSLRGLRLYIRRLENSNKNMRATIRNRRAG